MRMYLTSLFSVAVTAWAITASAQSSGGGTPGGGPGSDGSCATNADCPESYTCEVIGASAGCGWICPSDQPDCPPPPDCVPDETLIYGCVPGPCASDDDCEEGYFCFTDTWSDCGIEPLPGRPCMEGSDCDGFAPPPEECTDHTTSVCAPRPVPPCVDDADCGPGLSCEAVASGGCASCACPSGAMCDCPPCEPPPDIRECVPAPCTSDSDCGDGGLVCITVTYDICELTPACLDTMDPRDCGDGEAMCHTVSEGYCAPPYVAPCAVDADCGDHFRCVAAENCVCSGGAADPSAPAPCIDDGGQCPPPPPDGECSCEPTDERYCELIPIACTNDAECPEGWSCAQYETRAPCVMMPDGSVDCPGRESGGQCVPPAWGGGWAPESDGSREALARATGAADARATGNGASVGEHRQYGGCQMVQSGNNGWLSAMGIVGVLSMLALRRRRSR